MKLAKALRSFCLFCGLGIFIIYLLQATWSQFYKTFFFVTGKEGK
jgi:hypothetical protein